MDNESDFWDDHDSRPTVCKKGSDLDGRDFCVPDGVATGCSLRVSVGSVNYEVSAQPALLDSTTGISYADCIHGGPFSGACASLQCNP